MSIFLFFIFFELNIKLNLYNIHFFIFDTKGNFIFLIIYEAIKNNIYFKIKK